MVLEAPQSFLGLAPDARAKKDRVSMVLEIAYLPVAERARCESRVHRYPHLLQRLLVCYRRDEQAPVVFERYETTVEEVIDRGGEKQAVVSVETFGVGCIPPRFAVACTQVLGSVHAGDPTAAFRRLYALPEHPLTTPSQNE